MHHTVGSRKVWRPLVRKNSIGNAHGSEQKQAPTPSADAARTSHAAVGPSTRPSSGDDLDGEAAVTSPITFRGVCLQQPVRMPMLVLDIDKVKVLLVDWDPAKFDGDFGGTRVGAHSAPVYNFCVEVAAGGDMLMDDGAVDGDLLTYHMVSEMSMHDLQKIIQDLGLISMLSDS